jgi:acetyl/propionyl-CoA carboxylase alpha subunit
LPPTVLDLVRLQLLVAEGNPLPDEVLSAAIRGHAVEARLYAEDTAAGFLPASGTVHRFSVPPLDGVRVDAGVTDGSVVGVHYDPMLAKVIAYGPTRDEARRSLARALAGTRVYGVDTNRELLVGILREREFRAGDVDTGYLTRHDPVELALSCRDPQAARVHAVAAALAGQAERRTETPVLSTLPSGWRNVVNGPQQAVFTADGSEMRVTYRVMGNGVEATVDGEAVPGIVLHSASANLVELDVGGIRRKVRLHRVDDTSFVDSSLGATELTERPRFPDADALTAPGSLLAPMPGTVVRIAVEPGAPVAAGTTVVVLEAMKMEHSVTAPHDGIVGEIRVSVGESVDVGTVLAVVEAKEA